MPSLIYECIGRNDPHRAAVLSRGSVIITRWPEEKIPDQFQLVIDDAPIEAMEAVARAINAAIDAAHEARARKEAA